MATISASQPPVTHSRFPWRFLLLLFAAMILAPSGQASPENATITYRRIFKGSAPELIEIKIDERGKGTYEIRQLDEEPASAPFEVGPLVRDKIFELSAELKHFGIGDLDVHKNIADLGQKTFRYEGGAEVHETSFNYTLNATANQLMQIFEGLATQQGDLDLLEQRLKFDRLGVNDALLQFQTDLDHRLLPEPERLLPVLDRIAEDSRLVEIARTRARALAERIRASHDR